MKGLLRVAGSACLTCACATAAARQWTVIDGNLVGRADSNRYSVVVLEVDGKAEFDAPTTVTITPGLHHLKLASTRQDRSGTVVPYALNAEPCTRYEIHAEYESRLDRSPWQIVITTDPKPLGRCKPEISPDTGVTSAPVPSLSKPR